MGDFQNGSQDKIVQSNMKTDEKNMWKYNPSNTDTEDLDNLTFMILNPIYHWVLTNPKV